MKFSLLFLTLLWTVPAQEAHAIAHFYRQKAFSGGARKAPVFVDGLQIGELTNGSRFTIELPAGKHAIRSGSKDQTMNVELIAGTDEYFRVESAEKGMRAIWRVVHVASDQGKADCDRLPAVDPKHAPKR